MLVRKLPDTEIKNFHYFEKGTDYLKAAGVDLSVFARNLRKLDRTRMMIRSLERAVNRQRAMSMQMILKVKIRRTRGLENANNRIKGRMMLAYSQLFKNKQGPEKYFYSWFVKANPDILKKLAWHLIIKQKINISVAVFRLSYLAKIQTVRKKVNNVGLMEKLCWIDNFIQAKRFLDKKMSFDRLNPMHHNGKYFLVDRVWKRYMRLRRENLQKCMRVFTKNTGRIKRMMAILRGKNQMRTLEVFRNLRSFNRQQQKENETVKGNLENQKKDLFLIKYLMIWYRSQKRRAYFSLKNHMQNTNSKSVLEGTKKSNLLLLMKIRNEQKKKNAMEKLKKYNQLQTKKLQRENYLKKYLCRQQVWKGRDVMKKALEMLKQNFRNLKLRDKYAYFLGVNYKGKLAEAITKLRRAKRIKTDEEEREEMVKTKFFNQLVRKQKQKSFNALTKFEEYLEQEKQREKWEKGKKNLE